MPQETNTPPTGGMFDGKKLRELLDKWYRTTTTTATITRNINDIRYNFHYITKDWTEPPDVPKLHGTNYQHLNNMNPAAPTIPVINADILDQEIE